MTWREYCFSVLKSDWSQSVNQVAWCSYIKPNIDNSTMVIANNKGMPRSVFWKYTMLRHNELHVWEVIHIYPFETIWRNPYIQSSKTCRFHVTAMVFIVYFVLACKKSALLFQVISSAFLKSWGCNREQQSCLRMTSQIDLLRSSIEEKV